VIAIQAPNLEAGIMRYELTGGGSNGRFVMDETIGSHESIIWHDAGSRTQAGSANFAKRCDRRPMLAHAASFR